MQSVISPRTAAAADRQLIFRRINAITFLPLLHCIKQQINCTISNTASWCKPCIINYWKHKKCPAWWQYISVDSQHTFCQATQYLPATYNVHTKLTAIRFRRGHIVHWREDLGKLKRNCCQGYKHSRHNMHWYTVCTVSNSTCQPITAPPPIALRNTARSKLARTVFGQNHFHY